MECNFWNKNYSANGILAMVAVKMSRLINTPDHEDSWVDICGYGALGAEEKNDK